MNNFFENYLDKTDPCVNVNFENISDLKPKVMAMFRAMGTEHTAIVIENAHHHPFPVKAVDEYLRKHPEKVRKVTVLHLEFNRRKSEEILEMVRKRFPNIRLLRLPSSLTYPSEIGHALAQYAQMPKLRTLYSGISVELLAEHMQHNACNPLTHVKTLYCCIFYEVETFANFEATLPVIFPNLEQLYYPCPNAEFGEQIYANLGRFWPKMKMCKAIDASDVPAIVNEQKRPKFPIAMFEGVEETSDNEDLYRVVAAI